MATGCRWLAALGLAPPLFFALPPPQDEVEPIELLYQGIDGCPDRAAFMAELGARTARLRAARPGEPARAVRVAFERKGSVTFGHLLIDNPDRSYTRRDVSGADCAEVSSALALVTALIIDPRALEAAPPDAASPSAEQPDAAPPQIVGPTVPVSPPPVQAPAPVSTSVPAPSHRAPPIADSADDRRLSASLAARRALVVGGQASALVGPAPSTAWGGGAFVGFDDASAALLAPSARLSVLALTASDEFSSGVGARFTWILARPELCPLRPPLFDELRLELCAGADLGALVTTGRGLDQPERSTRFWVAPGASGRFAWLLNGGFLLELGGGLWVPLRRYPFTYQAGAAIGELEVHEVPWVAGTLNAGLGYRFQ